MSPHKPPRSLQKVEVDFVEILARVESSEPQLAARKGDQLELIGSVTSDQRGAFRARGVGWSTAANMTFALIAFFGALVCAVYFLNNSEYSRRLHTTWPREFLYSPSQSGERSSPAIAKRSSRVGSRTVHHPQQNADLTQLFRDLADAQPMSGMSPESFGNSNVVPGPNANQATDNFSGAGRSVADRSTGAPQSGMSEMRSAATDRTNAMRSRQRFLAASSRKASISRQNLFGWFSDTGERRERGGALSSMHSMKSNLSAMQSHADLHANHSQAQTRMMMTGGLTAHALHNVDLGGTVRAHHHGAHR